jgi:hypothetical protein
MPPSRIRTVELSSCQVHAEAGPYHIRATRQSEMGSATVTRAYSLPCNLDRLLAGHHIRRTTKLPILGLRFQGIADGLIIELAKNIDSIVELFNSTWRQWIRVKMHNVVADFPQFIESPDEDRTLEQPAKLFP